MDDQVRDESFLTQSFNLPVLASIPDLNANVSGKAYKYGKYGKYGRYGRYGKYGSYRSKSYYASASASKEEETTNGDNK